VPLSERRSGLTCKQESQAERDPADPFARMSRPRLNAFELHHQQKADVLSPEGLALGEITDRAGWAPVDFDV
jgi:hypothetical protein